MAAQGTQGANDESMESASANSAGGVELAPGVRVAADIVRFSFVSSGGPGGQNVNKRATKAELRLYLADLPVHLDVLQRLVVLAGQRLTDDGELVITADEHRSQARNKAECLDRLRDLIVRAKVRPRKRKPTKPTRSSRERRLKSKREVSEKKRTRQSRGEE
jgi:ribosome-associated protein